MAEYIQGINPDIVRWARERSGYTLHEIAKSFKKDIATISNWESGTAAPTYVQLETLADKYKRPVAMFFFPEPPQEPDFAGQLALRSSEIEQLAPGIRILLRQARARQLSLMELNMGVNPAETKIFRDLHAHLDDSPTELAQQTRTYLASTLKCKLVGAAQEKHSKIGERVLRRKVSLFLRRHLKAILLMVFASSTSSFQ